MSAEQDADPMAGVIAPLAARPAAPTPPKDVRLKSVPNFAEYAEEAEEAKEVGRRLQEMSSTGQRHLQTATAKMLAGDQAAASAALEEVAALPTPREIMGEKNWEDAVRRHRFCQANSVGWLNQSHLTCLTLLSFFEHGVLSPEMPDRCKLHIDDQDDERYLLGVIDTMREIEKYALNRGQALDLASLQICLTAAHSLEQSLMQFDFRNSDLRRRFDSVKYSVKKFENLCYEVDLANQRAVAAKSASEVQEAVVAATGGAAAPKAEPEQSDAGVAAAVVEAVAGSVTARPVLDLRALGDIKRRYDQFDACREQTMKRSRDIVKAAKNAVYALQRADYKKADGDLRQCAKDAEAVYKDVVATSPSLRGSLFSAGLEEMCEALAYRAFRRDKQLLTKAEMQAASGLSFEISLAEYFGGLMDLTGEVARLAIRTASRGRQAIPEVELCRACIVAVQEGCQAMPCMPPGVGNKMKPLRSTLSKVEGALYELALLSRGGLRVQAPSAREEGEDAEEGREEEG